MPTSNFEVPYTNQLKNDMFLSKISQCVAKQKKREKTLLSLNQSPLSVVSVREHHDFTLMLLAVSVSFPKWRPVAQNHSEAVSLCGLIPFCANPPPTTPATYCWESLQCHVSQSALPSVCLTLCLCCHGEVHSLMLCVNQAPVKFLSAFPVITHIC